MMSDGAMHWRLITANNGPIISELPFSVGPAGGGVLVGPSQLAMKQRHMEEAERISGPLLQSVLALDKVGCSRVGWFGGGG